MGVGYTLLLAIDKPVSVNLDGAMYMEGARILAAGGLPYVDFVDINPPLAIYLHSPAVWLSEITGLPLNNSFLLLILVATFASGATTYRLLTAAVPASAGRAALVAAAPALLLLYLVPNTDLGQRSHLFALALLPYLTLRTLRATDSLPRLNPLTSTLIGVAMGITLCLKPAHYAAMLAPAELYLLFTFRRYTTIFTAETITVIFVALGYGIHFLLLPDSVRAAFFDAYMPLILESYGAYATTTVGLLRESAEHVLLPLLITLSAATLMRGDRRADFATLAMLFGIVGTFTAVLFVVQGKGWAYHAVPVVMAALVGALSLAGRVAASGSIPSFGRFVSATPVLLGVTLALIGTSLAFKESNQAAKRYLRSYPAYLVSEYTEPDERIYMMSTSVDATYPMIHLLERRPATRYPFLFPLAMLYDGAAEDPASLYRYRIAAERSQFEQDFLQRLNGDLQRDRPRMIFVEAYPQCVFCPESFYLPDYLEAQSDMLPALQEYTEFARTRRFRVFYLGEPPELETAEDAEDAADS